MTRQAGFSLFELAIAISIISILAAIGVDRMWSLRVEAERAAVAQVVGGIRSALGLEVARRAVRGELHTLPDLAGSNPMELLAQQPRGYLGEVAPVNPAAAETGTWYFDRTTGALAYRPRFGGSFSAARPELRFRVVLRYRDNDGDGVFSKGADEISGLDLEALAAGGQGG